MNYYEHHIGDYAAATGHLSLVEDAVYTRMLRRYYLTETPLPADMGQVARLVGARQQEEIAAVEAVLGEFFTLQADGWHQKRADEDIAKYLEKQGKARASADARWAGKRSECERNANAMRTQCDGNAHQTPDTSNQQEQKQKKGRASAPACPEDVEPQVWADWLALRKAKRAPASETVIREARKEAAKAGMSFSAFLAVWCRRGSQGLEADWLKPNERQPQGPPATAPGKQVQGLMALEAMKRERMAGSGNLVGPAKTGLLVTGSDAGCGNVAGDGSGVD